jgi:hypothetical protein
MEVTKVIAIDHSSLGFEVGENPKWRGEFTLEQVAQHNIKVGKELTVNILDMEDVFATVEFDEHEKTTVQVTKIPENSELFAPEPSNETDMPEFFDTIPIER